MNVLKFNCLNNMFNKKLEVCKSEVILVIFIVIIDGSSLGNVGISYILFIFFDVFLVVNRFVFIGRVF